MTRGDGRNPFSVAVMREALYALQHPDKVASRNGGAQHLAMTEATPVDNPGDPAGCSACNPVQPTHYYLRFRPTDTDQLAELSELGITLSYEPLDETAAAAHQEPTSATIPWIYTAVPTDVALPPSIAQEKLADLFLFTADDGDIQDYDPWEPDPAPTSDCTPQYDASCNCFLPCPLRGVKRTKRNRIRETTAQLKKAGISPAALYDEAMRLTGHEDEMRGSGSATTAQRARRYRPSGTISVQERYANGSSRIVPLRNVSVISRRWFNLAHTRTNAAGSFAIGNGYLKEAKIIVEFKTERATTRGITPGMQPWDLVLPIRHQLGSYYKTQMQNLSYTFAYQSNANSKAALSWTAATLFNSLDDMYDFCAASNVPPPPPALNVMLLSNLSSSAAAPMLRHLTETSTVSTMLDALLPPAMTVIKRILQRQLPDITCRYAPGTTTRPTNDLDDTFFHELAHSMHYGQVGNDYWTAYIGHIVTAFLQGRSSTYGRKNDSGAGRIAISEAWGNYIGGTFNARKYDAIDFNISNTSRANLENQKPNDNVDDDNGWIVYGMLYDMTDTGEPVTTGVTDNVNTYTTTELFRALQSDVVSVRHYQQRVLLQNSNKQAPQLEQLVTSYRW